MLEDRRAIFTLDSLITITAVTMSLFQLYVAFFGAIESYLLRLTHLSFALILVYLVERGRGRQKGFTLADGCWLALTLASIAYLLIRYQYIIGERFYFVTPVSGLELFLGIIFMLVLLEATRRISGWAFPTVAVVFLIYVFAGPWLPGILRHGGYSLAQLVDLQYLSTMGIFGMPLGISASYVFLFVLFGSFLAKSGLGDLLMDVALGLTGRSVGGPAKVAVIASALFGTISGSPVSNVTTTGSFTIPLMKRLGYRPEFAGAVEAAASTGGQIMPPIMGVIAFMMAEYTGIPYIKIALHAVIPAILYYWGIYLAVHFEALRLGLRGLAPEETPQWKETARRKGHMVLPIVVLLFLLTRGYSPAFAVSYSILATLGIAALRKDTRMGWREILQALRDGAIASLLVVTSMAVAGLVSGVFNLTGLGLRFSGSLTELAGGSLFLMLFLTMVASLVLGMGLPASASYVIQVAVTIPAMVKILTNYQPQQDPLVIALTAHMFVMYFASIAVITPPVAMAAYAAAGIARGEPMRTGFIASRLAISAFVVPFMFVLAPGLLMVGGVTQILSVSLTALMGVALVAIGLEGFMWAKLSWWQRALMVCGGMCLIIPGWTTDVAGLALGGVGVAGNWYTARARVGIIARKEEVGNVRIGLPSKER